MGKLRFSIARLMGFVLVAALGFGGLKGANQYWASGCFTLMALALIVAILHAVQTRGRDRAYWAGFAIAGWVFSGVVFFSKGPNVAVFPPLLTEILFDQLEPLIHPEQRTSMVIATFNPSPVAVNYALAPPAPPAPVTPAPSDPPSASEPDSNPITAPPLPMPAPPPSVPLPPPPSPYLSPWTMPSDMTIIHFNQVAHSLTALLAGMLGGMYSVWLFVRREAREASPVTNVTPSSP